MVTDTATLCLYDLAALKHRARGYFGLVVHSSG